MSYKLYDAEIEYLQFTGTQYINIGYCQTSINIEIRIRMQWTGNTAEQFESFFGYMTNASTLTPRGGLHKYQGKWMFGTNSTITSDKAVDANIHDFKINGVSSPNSESLYDSSTLLRTGTTTSTGLSGNTMPYFVGCRNRNGSVDNYANMKIMSLSIMLFDNTHHTVVLHEMNLIPVRKGQVGYLYDRISGQLFGNAGTGNFILGPDVAPGRYANEVAFLESWGNQYIDTGIKPSTDTKIELKCLYCKSGAGLTNYGALIGADDRDTAYTLNHSAVANFTYGLEFSNNFANPQTRLLTFDSTASPQNMRVYDEGGSLVTTLTCLRGVFEVNQNLYLFATNRNGTPVYGSNRILYCKIYDGDTLVRDYVPIEYNGIGYMYDKVSGLFFDNKGTGKFLFGSIAKACARSYTRRQLMAENYVGKAPNGYKWLEYIENTSTAYINTGLKGKANLKIDATWLFKQSEVAGVMGASYSHKPNNALLYRANWTTGSYFYYGDSTAALTALTLNKKWHIVMDKGKLYYDDVLKKTLASTGDSTYNFMLFKVEDFGTCVKGQLFGCKIWDEVTLVRDYRPIKRLSDNKYGLWDIVHQSFYTSPNGVNFVGG